MNKQQFVAELQRFLLFMSQEDLDVTIRGFGELFDRFGEAGEEELSARLVSPTKVAIDMSRAYQSGGLEKALEPYRDLAADIPAEEPAEPETAAEPEPETEPESAPQPIRELEDEVFADLTPFELDDPENMELIPQEESEPNPDAEPAPADEPQPEAEPEPAAEPQPEVQSEPEAPAEPSPAPQPFVPPAFPIRPLPDDIPDIAPEDDDSTVIRPRVKKKKARKAEKPPLTGAVVPRGLGIPMFIFILLVLGIPLAILFITMMAVLLCPGLAILGGSVLSGIGCLWCSGYVSDLLLLAGLALALLALGVIILFAGIWLDVQLVIVYKQAVVWLGEALLGRRMPE